MVQYCPLKKKYVSDNQYCKEQKKACGDAPLCYWKTTQALVDEHRLEEAASSSASAVKVDSGFYG